MEEHNSHVCWTMGRRRRPGAIMALASSSANAYDVGGIFCGYYCCGGQLRMDILCYRSLHEKRCIGEKSRVTRSMMKIQTTFESGFKKYLEIKL